MVSIRSNSPFSYLAGSPASSVLLHVPHAATGIPEWVRDRILLSDAELDAEVDAMRDSKTDVIARRACIDAATKPHAFVNHLARQVVDPERFPDGRERMESVGHGAIYVNTSGLSPLRDRDPAHFQDLLDRFYHPYAEAMADAVSDLLAGHRTVTILDIHSYPALALTYEDRSMSRPEICIGTDPFHSPAALADAAVKCFATFETERDTPFSGVYVPLDFWRKDAKVQALMIEVRRDVCAKGEGLDRVIEGLVNLINLLD